jgi:3-hydroxybutyryl-CoA dehydrogenase
MTTPPKPGDGMTSQEWEPVRRVAVVGAGTMGAGIAQVCAAAGLEVALHDADAAQVVRAIDRIGASLSRAVERGKLEASARDEALTRLRAAPSLENAATDIDLAIEAVPERLDLKRSVFEALDTAAPAGAVLASNTSSLSISLIAGATRRAERVVGLHFFNPVHVMKLLEVVRGERTDRATLDRCLDFARRIDKEPIVVTDTPGFASSRLGVVLGLEAMRMVEEGVATPADIDRAMELGYNHPMGPLRLTDVVGLDVRLGIAEYLHHELGGQQYRPPEILKRMVDEGRLGRKSGRGFYDWEEG